jgi:ubiquinone/menaquinone biosynthesis C-methylase UbiE
MKVVAIDIDAGMIKYAKDLAQASRLNNVTFLEMNALEPLDFDDASFDLVNGRFLGGFIPTASWPKIIQEFLRVTRPGGTLRLTDADWDAETSSPSYNAMAHYVILATQRAHLSFSPDGRHHSINMMLSRFLHQAGCTNIREMAHVLNFSYGTPYHRPFYENTLVAFKLVQPFLVGMGVVTQTEIDQLYETLQLEMLKEDFTGIMYMLTAWGKKGESQ